MLKRWALVLLIAYAALLLVLSLITIGSMKTLGSSFDDKINHFGAYFILTLLLINYFRKMEIRNALVYALIVAAFYGCTMEVLQYVLTTNRMFDSYDMLANFFGAIFAVLFMIFYRKLKLK